MEGWARRGKAKLSRVGSAVILIAVCLSHKTYGRSLQAAMPAPAPAPSGVQSVQGLAASDCYNFPAVSDNEDTSFLGSIQRITVGPASIAYRQFGPLSTSVSVQQRPLVLVTGISLTMHDWTPRLLKALAAQREVVIFDSPGIGLSVISESSVPSPANYFIFQAECIAGLIAGLGLQQPDLLGWSLGAKIVLHVGVYYGSAVNKIISDAGSAGGPNSTTAVLSLVDHSATVYNRAAWVAAAAQRPSNVKAICQWLLETGNTPPEPVSADQVQAQLDAEAAYQAGQGLVPFLGNLKNPLLVITATNDMVNPPSDQVAIMQGVPDAVLVTFDGCGHLALFQEVSMFAALVDAFTAASGRFEPGPEYKCNAGAV